MLVSKKRGKVLLMYYKTLSNKEVKRIHIDLAKLALKPVISILLLDASSITLEQAKKTFASIKAQFYPHWELCILTEDEPKKEKFSIESEHDEKIKYFKVEQANFFKQGMAYASGEYCLSLHLGDVLTPDALYCLVKRITQRPNVQLIYSDEDTINKEGQRSRPYYKSGWDPLLFNSINFLGRTIVIASNIELGNYQPMFTNQSDSLYDFLFYLVENINPDNICHIPRILYHVYTIRTSSDLAHRMSLKATQEHFKRVNLDAKCVEITSKTGQVYPRIIYEKLAVEPKVTIVIPTRDRADLLATCITSVLENTDYKNYDILIIDNGSQETATLDYFSSLESYSNITVLRLDVPFNYSYLNNVAVKNVLSEFVCFLNNDTVILTSDWLEEMLSYFGDEKVGVVGAKLYYPNKTVQHAGVLLHPIDGAIHVVYQSITEVCPRETELNFAKSYMAVTGACMLMKKSIFDETNGFDENLQQNFTDIDLCVRAYEKGYRIIWTPHAQLIHSESASRGTARRMEKLALHLQELKYFTNKHKSRIKADPYTNINLDFICGRIGLRPHVDLRKLPFWLLMRHVKWFFINLLGSKRPKRSH